MKVSTGSQAGSADVPSALSAKREQCGWGRRKGMDRTAHVRRTRRPRSQRDGPVLTLMLGSLINV